VLCELESFAIFSNGQSNVARICRKSYGDGTQFDLGVGSMANVPLLYWRKRQKKAKPLSAAPFKSEQEFEQTVFDTPAVLGDIYLLKRQVRGGGKPGIPDIIGIDPEGRQV
jgi:hypothetical protein